MKESHRQFAEKILRINPQLVTGGLVGSMPGDASEDISQHLKVTTLSYLSRLQSGTDDRELKALIIGDIVGLQSLGSLAESTVDQLIEDLEALSTP